MFDRLHAMIGKDAFAQALKNNRTGSKFTGPVAESKWN